MIHKTLRGGALMKGTENARFLVHLGIKFAFVLGLSLLGMAGLVAIVGGMGESMQMARDAATGVATVNIGMSTVQAIVLGFAVTGATLNVTSLVLWIYLKLWETIHENDPD